MDEQPEPPARQTLEVEYQKIGHASNEDLRGRGTFAVETTEPRYRFTGRPRSLLEKADEVVFRTEQIRNVVVEATRVQFHGHAGISGQSGVPFVFYCDTPEDAARARSLLPAAQESGFSAERSFDEHIASLAETSSPWKTVTVGLIGANLVAYVIMGLLGAGWFETADMTPYVDFAANNAAATTDGEWWRLLTSMFVHYGLMHLLLNMWALHGLGIFVERLFGRRLFALGYLGSGLVAGFVSMRWHGDTVWSAGASSAVFGVYGLLFGFMLREKLSIPPAVRQTLMKSTLAFAGYNLVYGLVHPQIDNAAHLGGLAGGFMLGWVMALPLEREARQIQQRVKLKHGLIALTVLCALGVAVAPRYDYNVHDELVWADAIQPMIGEESAILSEQKLLEDRYRRDVSARDEVQAWVRESAIPFYERFLKAARAMSLSPEKSAAARRDVTVTLVEAKLVNYRELAAAVARKDPDAFTRFEAADKVAERAASPDTK